MPPNSNELCPLCKPPLRQVLETSLPLGPLLCQALLLRFRTSSRLCCGYYGGFGCRLRLIGCCGCCGCCGCLAILLRLLGCCGCCRTSSRLSIGSEKRVEWLAARAVVFWEVCHGADGP